jgi:hypothetical protein
MESPVENQRAWLRVGDALLESATLWTRSDLGKR